MLPEIPLAGGGRPDEERPELHRWTVEFKGDYVRIRRIDLGVERRNARRAELRRHAEAALAKLEHVGELDADEVRSMLSEMFTEAARPNDSTGYSVTVPRRQERLPFESEQEHADVLEQSAGGKRGRITGWSAKSRVRMMRKIAGLDMRGRWGMLTLTATGGEWWKVCGTPKAAKEALSALARRWERAFGEPLSMVWKMEFQRRGAWHFHVGIPLAEGIELDELRDWFAREWHEVLVHPGGARCPGDSCEHRWHRRHGTKLDSTFGRRVRQARSTFAAYFAKHAAWASKSVQNEGPAIRFRRCSWLLEALGCDGSEALELAREWEHMGRWWGTRHVNECPTVEGSMERAEVEAARLICRKVWSRRTWRYVEHPETPPVLVRRTIKSLHGDAGLWMLASDPEAFRWWFLDAVRRLAQISGRRERARFLATLEEPGSRPRPGKGRAPVRQLAVR